MERFIWAHKGSRGTEHPSRVSWHHSPAGAPAFQCVGPALQPQPNRRAPTSIFMATASPLRATSTGLWSFSKEAIRPRSTPPCGRSKTNDMSNRLLRPLVGDLGTHSSDQGHGPRAWPHARRTTGAPQPLTRLGTQMGAPTLAMPSTTCGVGQSGSAEGRDQVRRIVGTGSVGTGTC